MGNIDETCSVEADNFIPPLKLFLLKQAPYFSPCSICCFGHLNLGFVSSFVLEISDLFRNSELFFRYETLKSSGTQNGGYKSEEYNAFRRSVVDEPFPQTDGSNRNDEAQSGREEDSSRE